MIISYFLSFILYGLSFLLSPFPTVDVLPFGVDELLLNGFGYFRIISEAFPPFALMLEVTLWYLGYRVGLIILKVFMGHRTPHLA